ncbi:hypothetical protein Pcinc_015358 [Petrolisthes cinctipes]|uniref:Uncharacterized protein n=1 Tax=Petrolisthes cinctipes TaxID=88211 RepID=A0AAE1F0Y5_PETCI|nr:hypothetical protein Pcinc_029164 [Petrolisthes cinctipes]KAK3880124.1 hypothetical protein Pcinc_015358 [Petrolisthes cinctipes]
MAPPAATPSSVRITTSLPPSAATSSTASWSSALPSQRLKSNSKDFLNSAPPPEKRKRRLFLCVVLAEPLLGRLSSDSAALEVPSFTSTHLDSEGKKELVALEL